MKKVMREVLLVYPEFPVSFWGFQYAIEFILGEGEEIFSLCRSSLADGS
jgi:hypothetical protein